MFSTLKPSLSNLLRYLVFVKVKIENHKVSKNVKFHVQKYFTLWALSQFYTSLEKNVYTVLIFQSTQANKGTANLVSQFGPIHLWWTKLYEKFGFQLQRQFSGPLTYFCTWKYTKILKKYKYRVVEAEWAIAHPLFVGVILKSNFAHPFFC